MERFIARENIKRFEQQLESCTDDVQRAQLQKLLAAEQKKLNDFDSDGNRRLASQG